MSKWKLYKLGEIARFQTGKLNSNAAIEGGKYPFFTCSPTTLHIDNYAFDQEAILLAGNNAEGNFSIKYYNGKFNAYQRTYVIEAITEYCETRYLFYSLKLYLQHFKYISQGTSTKFLTASILRNIPISLPPLETQKRIADILSAIDGKIELNRRINANLEQQAQALYKSWFVDFEPWGGVMPEDWREGIASDFYDITIGKTPPRKETQWFSNSKKNHVWISISDMGKNGMFLGQSSEYLTPLAIEKFNIVIVPDSTVLLSFKLTVGRVSISDGAVTTNEAIAHFKTKKQDLLEYTYLSLKNYEFSALGSTSSIATAVNSKTIKSMRWIMPNHDLIKQFHEKAGPIFNMIKQNEKENNNLSTLRDTLLPKLMSGEIKI